MTESYHRASTSPVFHIMQAGTISENSLIDLSRLWSELHDTQMYTIIAV